MICHRRLLSRWAMGFLGVSCFLALTLVMARPAPAQPVPDLVAHWAPVLYHDLDGSYADDYITRFDFDGDWDAWNNEANLQSGLYPLVASVYYAVIETKTHWYLTYAFFHPTDSSIFLITEEAQALCVLHENDMEGVTLAIQKDGSPHGTFRFMSTEAHGNVYYSKPSGSDVTIGMGRSDPATGGGGPDSIAYFPRSPREVAAFIEADGHGVGSQYRALTPSGGGPIVLGGVAYDFSGGSGITCFYDGGPGEEPTGASAESVRYDLVPLDEIWSRRDNSAGNTFCNSVNFVGTRGCALENLAYSFGGGCIPFGSCAANPPWGWETDVAGVPRGEWFLDPAHTASVFHLEDLPEGNDPGFLDYISNPYLQGDVELQVIGPGETDSWMVGSPGLIQWTHDDTGQGPLFAGTVLMELSRTGGPWEPIADGIPLAGGSFSWPVTGPPTGQARVRVLAGTDCILTITAMGEEFAIVSDPTGIPGPTEPVTRLHPARPNPFVQTAQLAFDLAQPNPVRLQIYDVAGRPVRTLIHDPRHPAGPHTTTWDGRDDRGRRVSPGLYYYRLDAGSRVLARKLVLAP